MTRNITPQSQGQTLKGWEDLQSGDSTKNELTITVISGATPTESIRRALLFVTIYKINIYMSFRETTLKDTELRGNAPMTRSKNFPI